jgi:hypothetical protein
VLTLGLGIGANTAMFCAMQGVVLAPLKYVNSDRLVMIWEKNPHFPRGCFQIKRYGIRRGSTYTSRTAHVESIGTPSQSILKRSMSKCRL